MVCWVRNFQKRENVVFKKQYLFATICALASLTMSEASFGETSTSKKVTEAFANSTFSNLEEVLLTDSPLGGSFGNDVIEPYINRLRFELGHPSVSARGTDSVYLLAALETKNFNYELAYIWPQSSRSCPRDDCAWEAKGQFAGGIMWRLDLERFAIADKYPILRRVSLSTGPWLTQDTGRITSNKVNIKSTLYIDFETKAWWVPDGFSVSHISNAGTGKVLEYCSEYHIERNVSCYSNKFNLGQELNGFAYRLSFKRKFGS